jgi:gliding motility-associated protein GldE
VLESAPDDPHIGVLNFAAVLLQSTAQNFSLEVVIAFVAIVVLLFASALVSGSEAAFFSLTKENLEELENGDSKENKGKRSVAAAIKLIDSPQYLLATILIANNLINVAIIVCSWFALDNLLQNADPLLVFATNVVGATLILVLFGEVIPKVYATHNAQRFALRMSSLLLFLRGLFRPVSAVLVGSTQLIEKRLEKLERDGPSLEEMDRAIEIAAGEQTAEQQVRLLKGVVQFASTTVKQIMTSHVDMVSVDQAANFHELVEVIKDSEFSRIPVYRDDKSNIIGMFYAKDLLAYLDRDAGFDWRIMIRDAYFVPEAKKIDDLLEEFQEKRIHLAIVVDEYGGTSGLVTLEDVMEEVIGEIEDEFDEEHADYRKIDERTYIFQGKILLGDVCKALNLRSDAFDEMRGESDTLAGLLLELAGKIPTIDEEINNNGFRFTVLEASRSRVIQVKVHILSDDLLERHNVA